VAILNLSFAMVPGRAGLAIGAGRRLNFEGYVMKRSKPRTLSKVRGKRGRTSEWGVEEILNYLSKTSRTLRAKASSEKGFSRKGVPGSPMPLWMMVASV